MFILHWLFPYPYDSLCLAIFKQNQHSIVSTFQKFLKTCTTYLTTDFSCDYNRNVSFPKRKKKTMRIEIAYRWFLILTIIASATYIVTTSFGDYSPIPYFGSFIVFPAATGILVYDWFRQFENNNWRTKSPETKQQFRGILSF